MNINDIIAFFSPRYALRRETNKRYYEAASHGRHSLSFKHATPAAPNADLGSNLYTLLNRSRYLYKNNLRIKRAVTILSDNVIGEGIRPAPTGTKKQNEKILSLWKSWAGELVCNWNESTTFYGIQDLVMRELAIAGECFVVRRRTNDPIPIRLQVIQSEQIDISRNFINELGIAKLGIQFDSNGRLTGYWIFPERPGEVINLKINQSVFVPKEDCLHIYIEQEAGLVRGVPFGVQSFLKSNMLDDYDNATLEKQRGAASLMGFVSGSDNKPDETKPLTIQPGTISYLDEGEQVTFSNPPTVNDYDPYTRALLRGIASNYGVTYESLTMDYSNVNFTSGRMGKIDVTPGFKKIQYNTIAPLLCAPVWKWFMDACVIADISKLYISCGAQDWTAPRIQQIDPLKETNADIAKFNYGLTTYSEMQRERGNDPDDVISEIASDQEKFKQNNILFPLFKTPTGK